MKNCFLLTLCHLSWKAGIQKCYLSQVYLVTEHLVPPQQWPKSWCRFPPLPDARTPEGNWTPGTGCLYCTDAQWLKFFIYCNLWEFCDSQDFKEWGLEAACLGKVGKWMESVLVISNLGQDCPRGHWDLITGCHSLRAPFQRWATLPAKTLTCIL